jgi:hypothetical protein
MSDISEVLTASMIRVITLYNIPKDNIQQWSSYLNKSEKSHFKCKINQYSNATKPPAQQCNSYCIASYFEIICTF